MKSLRRVVCSVIVGVAALSPCTWAQSDSAFTYQGRMTGAGGIPTTGTANLRFQLFDAPTGGASLAGPVTVDSVPVNGGLFAASVDFGGVFGMSGRGGWIEAAVIDGQGGATVLSPRQRVSPVPLASGIVGLPLVGGVTVVDRDNTASPVDNAIVPAGGTTTAYFRFKAASSGRLASVVFRINVGGGTPTFFSSVLRGQGLEGQNLGSMTPVVFSPSGVVAETEVDYRAANVTLVAGEWYTVAILCAAAFAGTNQPLPDTGGANSNGHAVNWWFRTLVEEPRAVSLAVSAQSAATALTANTAATATTATTATTAQSLIANTNSALGDFELRFRGAQDSSHGIGYFGGATPFRNSGFAPDGPVIFGASGGGLGTTFGNGNIALQWNSWANVGIGTAAPGGGGFRLELPNTANNAGRGRANAWVTYSSRDLKDDIETLPDALETLRKLRGVSFTWKQPLPDGTRKHDIGFIAEEVAAVVPDVVSMGEGGGTAALDYGRVVPITVEAIKAQQAQIEMLRDENAALKKRLETIEAAIVKGVKP